MCLFNCFDNTYYNIKEDLKKNLCSASHTEENKKVVLIMPFIAEGSIKNFNWIENKLDILKSVLSQTIMSLFLAYHKLGFLHNDMHLDNILITPFYISNADFYIVLNHIKIIYNSFLFFVFYSLEHIFLVFHKHP